MGTYLSTPVTDKSTESGESLKTSSVPCRWGVVDQQGWRKSMEDAHIAVTDLPLPAPPPPDDEDDNNVDNMVSSSADAKVFGVFDGHGGAEVARFCQLYLVSVLTQQPTWTTSGNGEGLGRLPTSPDDPSIPSDPDDLDQAAKTPVGMALRSTFHALDRMIDDPTRRQEILQLRNMKPQLGERREATSIPPEVDTSSIVPPPFYLVRPASVSASASAPEEKETDKAEENDNEKENENETAADDDKESTVDSATEATTSADSDITAAADDENDNQEDNSEAPEASEAQDSEEGDCDDDSEQAVGLEEAAEQDRDTMMDDDDDNDDDNNDDEANSSGVIVEELDVSEGPNSTKTEEKVTTMFQKILALGTTSGQIVVSSGNDDDSKSKTQRAEQGVTASSTGATLSPPVANMSAGPDARVPTVSHNGRMICNLPDHPIHAGATAIVAVLTGGVLTVANAGDSRAVLCRAGGETFPLSFDHKPSQEREMTRIKHSGGFVNHFGRVNGNLNLSRSIGDLKYKQVPGIPPSDQMITAEPDIKQVGLKPDDDFIILGCDGIWDCLTNEQAVEFVSKRIDTMLPTEIGIEMLDQIISDDPRVTQGIGGDNQTVMIIDLQPSSRSCHPSSSELKSGANGENSSNEEAEAAAPETTASDKSSDSDPV